VTWILLIIMVFSLSFRFEFPFGKNMKAVPDLLS